MDILTQDKQQQQPSHLIETDLDDDPTLSAHVEQPFTDVTIVDNTQIQETGVFESKTFELSKIEPSLPISSIQEQLSRRYVIGNLQWNLSDNFSTLLKSYDFPAVLFQQPRIRQLLSRYQFFRASVEVEIRVNANRFQYGSLIASYLPMAPDSTATFSVVNSTGNRFLANQRMTDSFQATLNPHLIVSAQQNQTVLVQIPWECPFEWINLGMTGMITDNVQAVDVDLVTRAIVNQAIGRFDLRVLSPLCSAVEDGSTHCYVQVLARFVNPQVNGPTMSTWTLPTEMVEYQAKIKTTDIQPYLASLKPNSVPDLFEIVSSPLASVVSLAKSCVINTARKAWDYLGFSKPSVISEIQNRNLSLQNDLSSIVGQDISTSLALMPDASVVNAIEEFHPHSTLLSDLVAEETLLTFTNILPSQTVGTEVLWTPVLPAWSNISSYDVIAQRAISNVAGTLKLPSTNRYNLFGSWAAVFSNCFQAWRGEAVYRFHFYASAYHQARILIVWTPTPLSTSPMETGYGDLLSKQVVIQDGEVDVEFRVPYCQDVNFLYTNINRQLPYIATYESKYNPHTGERQGYVGQANGFISVWIANTPVVMQTNSVAPIWMFVYQRFEKFSFEHYQSLPDNFPAFTLVPTPSKLEQVDYQAKVEEPELFLNYGDQPTDVLSLTHRYVSGRVLVKSINANTTHAILPSLTTILNDSQEGLRPAIFDYNARSVIGISNLGFINQLQYLYLPYRFYRGSTRLRIVGQLGNDIPSLAVAHLNTYFHDSATYDSEKVGMYTSNGTRWMYSSYYPSMEISTPFYNRFNFSYLWMIHPETSLADNKDIGYTQNETPFLSVLSTYQSTAPTTLSFMISTGDDVRFSGKSAPPYLAYYSILPGTPPPIYTYPSQ